MKKSWVLMMIVGVVWSAGGWAEAAIDCSTELPSCAELGYTHKESDCLDTRMVRCPFDRSAVMCRDLRGTVKPCLLGDILYSDLQCYSTLPTNMDEIGLEPIAMVLNPGSRLAVGFEETGLQWGNRGVSGMGGTDGKALTQTLVEVNGASTDYAAGYCYYGYRTDLFADGTWFLPSMEQLKKLTENEAKYNTAAASVGGTLIPYYPEYGMVVRNDYSYWSSNPNTPVSIWCYIKGRSGWTAAKDNPIMEFRVKCMMNY